MSSSGEALNTFLEQVSVNPETNRHVGIVNEVQTCTTADVEVAIDYVGVVEHNRSSSTQCINVNICTVRVETSGSELHKKKGRKRMSVREKNQRAMKVQHSAAFTP